MLKRLMITLLLLLVFAVGSVQAQDLAAVMEVLSGTVEMQRVGTSQWLPVNVEAIVGVGDTIRTDDTGSARITFFANGVDTVLESNTEYRIEVFEGDEDTFQISARVLAGQTQQRLNRVLDAESSYDVITPGVNLVARGTVFAVRVEDDGRSAMLVTEGVVGADNDAGNADVPAEFGIRADEGGALSDVVRASTFDQLDSALDGCNVAVSTPDDVRLNVRLGASEDFARVGSLAADDISILKGVTASGSWYRVDFRGGYGWILSSTAEIQGTCAGLRVFEDDFGPEDATLYEFLGDPISLDDLNLPAADADTEASDSDES